MWISSQKIGGYQQIIRSKSTHNQKFLRIVAIYVLLTLRIIGKVSTHNWILKGSTDYII